MALGEVIEIAGRFWVKVPASHYSKQVVDSTHVRPKTLIRNKAYLYYKNPQGMQT